jgi:hypothetical protein
MVLSASPQKRIKNLRNLLFAPLAFLYNYSFIVGEVPKSFKIAKVIPIYKKGSKVTMSNSNHSTAQAIRLITDKIQNSIENKLFSSGIFLDIRIAFVPI